MWTCHSGGGSLSTLPFLFLSLQKTLIQTQSLHQNSVCMYVHVCACVCAYLHYLCICVSVGVCVQEVKGNFWCLPQLLTILYFEKGLPLKQGLTIQSGGCRASPISPSLVLELEMHAAVPSF